MCYSPVTGDFHTVFCTLNVTDTQNSHREGSLHSCQQLLTIAAGLLLISSRIAAEYTMYCITALLTDKQTRIHAQTYLLGRT